METFEGKKNIKIIKAIIERLNDNSRMWIEIVIERVSVIVESIHARPNNNLTKLVGIKLEKHNIFTNQIDFKFFSSLAHTKTM